MTIPTNPSVQLGLSPACVAFQVAFDGHDLLDRNADWPAVLAVARAGEATSMSEIPLRTTPPSSSIFVQRTGWKEQSS
jgi:hypothetical protein